MHRVRVGLTGLACVFLLVMLATAFLRGVGGSGNEAAATVNAAGPSEPLAELGVAPGNPQIDAPPPPPLIVPPPVSAARPATANAPPVRR